MFVSYAFPLDIILVTHARAIFAIVSRIEVPRGFKRAETPPEYARTRMAKRHATLRDDTRLPGGAVCYVSISILRRCIANATVHCTSSLERVFGVSRVERRANYNVARMLNAVPFPRSQRRWRRASEDSARFYDLAFT